MEERIIELAATQGIWSVLAIALIFYILKNQEKRDLRQEGRENKYRDIISRLTDKLDLVYDLKQDIEEIKEYMYKKV